METEFQNAVGKGLGEVVRDIREFLTRPCAVNPDRGLDLCRLLPELNMHWQFSFALLSEAREQGWESDAAESFYRHAVTGIADDALITEILAAFREPKGEKFRALSQKYGNRFTLSDGSYWSTCLALGIDADRVDTVLQYLRLFTVCLMEFAYMENRNPKKTYTWCYYESFRRMLDALATDSDAAPLPLKIRAMGGTAGKRDKDGYLLSLGVDVENPNPDRMARDIEIDVTLKDRDGNVITVIKDQLQSLDPSAVYHFGVLKKVRGAAVASLAASAKASSHLKLSTPIMKHLTLTNPNVSHTEDGIKLLGTLTNAYDTPLRSVILHYQYLSADNKILGGGSEWILDELPVGASLPLSASLPITIPAAEKVLYSVDFDALELVK
ncbi:MAG: hypothetical protein IKJ35_04580 [Clostridia bacterium]|nr:hypothetical protein [Clostridia bacterium]